MCTIGAPRRLATRVSPVTYQSRLNAMTSGEGRYTIAFSHYEPAPASVQNNLRKEHKPVDVD